MNRPEEPRDQAPKVAAKVGEVKAEKSAQEKAADRQAERVKQAHLEEQAYTVLECIRVPNEDGSAKSAAQISEETGIKDEDLYAALDVLASQSPPLIECSTANGVLVYHVCPGVPAEPVIVLPPPPPPAPPAPEAPERAAPEPRSTIR